MTKKEQQKFEREVNRCKSLFSKGITYADGGQDWSHALPIESQPCSCGHHSHYTSPDGRLYPSLYDRDNISFFQY